MIRVDHVPQRLTRWFLFTSLLALVTFGVAGRLDLPMLNAYMAVMAGFFLAATLLVDLDLLKERTRRGQTGADPRTAHEDRFLREHLEGYREYAVRVPFRLVPRVW